MRAPFAKGEKISLRKHLETIANNKLADPTNKKFHPMVKEAADRAKADLDAHGECPHQLLYIWHAFLELGWNFSWTDLQAWAQLKCRKLDNWEIQLIARLSGIRNEVNG